MSYPLRVLEELARRPLWPEPFALTLDLTEIEKIEVKYRKILGGLSADGLKRGLEGVPET